jgi:peroxiredoxin
MRTIFFLIIVFSYAYLYSQETRRAKDAQGLPAGVKAPIFETVDSHNEIFSLSEALENGPVVLIFYRGHWCPVCDKHLGQLQDSLSLITDRGATVIAVSPQKPEFLEKMKEKTGAEFRLLYDEGYKIADAYDVTFKPALSEIVIYNTVLGAQLKESQSDESQQLPIPATYIINSDGMIVWRQFDPDYKKRSSVKEILEIL